MNPIKTIRARLGMTQQELAVVLEMSQGNVSLYELGQAVPPAVASCLISYACAHGCPIGYDDIYGTPPAYKSKQKPTQTTASIAQAATNSEVKGVANAF